MENIPGWLHIVGNSSGGMKPEPIKKGNHFEKYFMRH